MLLGEDVSCRITENAAGGHGEFLGLQDPLRAHLSWGLPLPICRRVCCMSDLRFVSESIPGARVTAHREILGRRDEQQQLALTLREARRGRGGAVVIRGEAGIGKSALLDDLADKAKDCRICRAASSRRWNSLTPDCNDSVNQSPTTS